MIDIRVPATLSADPRQAMEETRRFLFQLCEQLNKGLADFEKQQTRAMSALQMQTADIAQKAKTESRWNEIKTLIIKSADIVSAFTEEISRTIAGSYVAKSEFGTYQDEIANRIDLAPDSITSRITSLETINSEWVTDIDTVREMEGTIKAGVLYTDGQGNRIVGVEVGERIFDDGGNETFNKFARFTSDRLSFYDAGGNEAAYLSDERLYINDARILDSLKIGGYSIDPTDGLAFRWVGRSDD